MNFLISCLLIILCLLNTLLAQTSWIRINQVGYQTNSVKVAVFGSKDSVNVENFQLVDVLTEKVVYNSQNIVDYSSYACFKKTFRLNFSDFTKSGTYYIKIDKVKSPNFIISENPYKGAADFLLNYMRQQRCGYNPFLKDSCHTHDGFIVDYPELDSIHINVTGGWHDASDYLQYVTTSANAIYQILFAFQQNPHAFNDFYDENGNKGSNKIPDILDEAKWGLDWLNKMNPEYGIMFNQIADDRDHKSFRLPTLDSVKYGKNLERPVYFVTGKKQGLAKYKNRTTGVSSTAGKYASAFSLGAQLLKDYYPKFSKSILKKAEEAYRFANTDLGVTQTACNVSPYFYEEDNYVDDLELAAVQLSLSTSDSILFNEAQYWGNLEETTPWMGADTARHYQWYPFVNLGHFLIAKNSKGKVKNKFIQFIKNGIDKVYNKGKKNAFLMGVPFIWCSNNLVVALLTQIQLYKSLTNDSTYDDLEASMRDWLFGCNPWGTSMIVGYPKYADTPVDPHSAFSAVFNYTINGGLVDGPVYTSIFNKLRGLRIVNGDEYSEFQSDLCVYHDDYGDYSTNEPTMDGTASLTYYLSSLEEKENLNNNLLYESGAIRRGDTTKKNIHLVFTGGDFNDGGNIIQQTLKKQDIKAHFFFTGDFYRHKENYDLINQLKYDGHYLGAHSDKHLLYCSWNNRDSLLISKRDFINDLKHNYHEMKRFGITKEDAKYFLPPYEWYNEEISNWTKELGLSLVNFTSGTFSNADYTTPTMKNYLSSREIYARILNYEESNSNGLNGFFLLLHVGTHPDRTDKFYNELESLITNLKNKGYKFSLFTHN